MAPEVIKDEKYNGKADVFSFAILMFHVVTDQIPYPDFQGNGFNFLQVCSKICRRKAWGQKFVNINWFVALALVINTTTWKKLVTETNPNSRIENLAQENERLMREISKLTEKVEPIELLCWTKK